MGAPVNTYRYGGPREAATVFGALDVPRGPGTAPPVIESSFQNALFFFAAETVVACVLAYLMRQEMRRGSR